MADMFANGPLAHYEKLLVNNELKQDQSQKKVVEKLERLYQNLCFLKSNKKSILRFFKSENHEHCPHGLYIHGDVGRGKSMLMDLFYKRIPITDKRRVHFHEFMQEAHAEIHKWRKMSQEQKTKESGHKHHNDPIPYLAQKIASQARLLCFDEFHVSDVADAMILGKLYKNLFDLGVVIVSTSNRPPEELYMGGLNRELFLPFIKLIQEKVDIVSLAGPVDYRYQRIRALDVYHTPVNEETTLKLKEAFWALTDRDVGDSITVPSEEITVQGRKLFVPKVAKGVAVFSFKRLCANPLGAADYLAIAWRYHTVIIVAIPKMSKTSRNEAKRFVTLIDVLYENNVKLLCSAEVLPEELYPEGDGAFEFSRTVSRLMEMQSKEYLSRGHAV